MKETIIVSLSPLKIAALIRQQSTRSFVECYELIIAGNVAC